MKVLSALCLLTAAGGALDAWTFVAHGHVFANAQTGNVVLIMIALAEGAWADAVRRLPSLAAYAATLFGSRVLGLRLKRAGLNSRSVRLGLESVMLVMLAMASTALSDAAITAIVGCIAAVQITSVSHVGAWTFNTGMTTGNLRSAAVAAAAALEGDPSQWAHAGVMVTMCLAFATGALLGAWLTPFLLNGTLIVIAGSVAIAAILCRNMPDPLPSLA